MIARYTYPGPFTYEQMRDEFVHGEGDPRNWPAAIIFGQSTRTDKNNYIYAVYGKTPEGKANTADVRRVIIAQGYPTDWIPQDFQEECAANGEVLAEFGTNIGDCIGGILRMEVIPANMIVLKGKEDNELYQGVMETISSKSPQKSSLMPIATDGKKIPLSQYPGTFYDINRFNEPISEGYYRILRIGTKKISNWNQVGKIQQAFFQPIWQEVEDDELTWDDLSNLTWHEFSKTGKPDPKFW